MDMCKNKIKGALYGAAIGDAMGATTEFMSKEQIKAQWPGGLREIIGGGAFQWRPGEVTDDTQMAMCVMDALMASYDERHTRICQKQFRSELSYNFCHWLDTKPKDIGNTCWVELTWLRTDRNHQPRKIPAEKQGNGGLMRTLPAALLEAPYYENHLGRIQNNFTHWNTTCMNAIRLYTDNVRGYLQYGICRCSVATSAELMEPTGCVINTLNNALYWAWHCSDFESGIVGPVNDGGDADTIACVAGGLVGAKFGYDAIPIRWIEMLDKQVKNKLDKFADWVCIYHERKGLKFPF